MSEKFDVVIIGGGMTGLSAAIYTCRAKLTTVILERTLMGGQIINTDDVENYPGFKRVKGFDIITAVEEQASSFGVRYEFSEVASIDASKRPFVIKTDELEYEARAIIIATGGDHVKLGVPGEKEFESKGVSYCATCDGNFFTEKEVTVIGGGDSALEEGLYLTRMCSKVTVVHRRDTLRASKVLQERAFANPKMNFIWDSVVDSINGNGSVNALTLKNLKTGATSRHPTDGIFVYIGFLPNSVPFKGLLDMDPAGHIKVDLKMETSVPGIFAAGDIRWQSTRQLANSAGDGVTAAIAAYEFLESHP